MDNIGILTANYLDILYVNRNKEYGSYFLRKTYLQRMRNASLIILSAAIVLSAYSVLGSNRRHIGNVLTTTTPIELTHLPQPPAQPLPPIIPPPPATTQPKEAIKITPPVIAPDDHVADKDLLPIQSSIANKTIGVQANINTTGDFDAPDFTRTDNKIIEDSAPEAPVEYVEQMPEFNGNVQQYLSAHIHYPELAKEANIEGTVIVRFVVNEDGAISYAKIVRKVGGGCDEEAIRVILSMPKWKPGRQNGKAVKVYFVQPISFRIQ